MGYVILKNGIWGKQRRLSLNTYVLRHVERWPSSQHPSTFCSYPLSHSLSLILNMLSDTSILVSTTLNTFMLRDNNLCFQQKVPKKAMSQHTWRGSPLKNRVGDIAILVKKQIEFDSDCNNRNYADEHSYCQSEPTSWQNSSASGQKGQASGARCAVFRSSS